MGSSKGAISTSRLPHSTIISCFCDGAVFKGSQKSKGKEYKVEVTIQHVDTMQKSVCGIIKMDNLTQSYPVLTTYFEGEVISSHYPFITGKWNASAENDIAHWEKIANGSRFNNFYCDDFDYSKLERADVVFMRWKERFVLPDPRVKEIDGASFAGFYYVGLKKTVGEITGYYYHWNSEQFQSLDLQYQAEDTPSTFQIY